MVKIFNDKKLCIFNGGEEDNYITLKINMYNYYKDKEEELVLDLSKVEKTVEEKMKEIFSYSEEIKKKEIIINEVKPLREENNNRIKKLNEFSLDQKL